ncbi:MAG: beta-phosphoglucomutase [Bacteroidales bacterium]|jgi:beta-phosphoglucomutase|nr:beta-phosphoglucomutase [Bacteroidales bacterium]MDD3385005.1 beta-phosphoglucomutase [Bacteroidales bacterium]MDD3812424.1 beta-phosphoglucomutase [Bacteroidales bacterium]MDD4812705.1 beta-phosphoglucomutase [Bacteroidales bacterium]NLO69309.1 beta-phosphoglucomutase [Bacteroidales bacterium]
MIKGLIFDLDGVVVNTAVYHFQAWNRLANSLGFEFTEEDNERLKGVSRMESLNILLEIGGLTLPTKEKLRLASVKNEWYKEFINQMTASEILPGVTNFIDLVKSHGYQTALGTASRNAPLILERIGMQKTFDAIIDGNQVTKAKPDPEVFLKASAALNLEPSQCVVFEDAIAGLEAAHRAGMKCIGVGDQKTLTEADRVIPGFVNVNLSLLQL